MYISRRFSLLLDKIKPTLYDEAAYEGHQHTVTRRVQAVFTDPKIKRIGSYSRDSAIHGKSDLDLLLTLRREDVMWGGQYKQSSTVLNEVRDRLQDRYTATAIGRDGQAVVIQFDGGARAVDVVPAIYKGPGTDNYPIYYIPDGNGLWMETAPELHNRFINSGDERSGGKLKNVARMIKYWRACRTPAIPLNSFHVELLLANEGICTVGKSYSATLRDAFALLWRRDCRALQDPLGISGWIYAANTEAKLKTALEAVQSAASRSGKAVEAEEYGDSQEAWRLWNLIFNGEFPRG